MLADVFLNFRNLIFNDYELDCCKYISTPSLSKDCCLKYSRAKIENIMDIDVFNFVKKGIAGGLSNSINPYEKIENDNQNIVMIDIASQYPCETAKKYRLKIIDLFNNLMKTDIVKIKIMVVYCYVM